MFFCGTLAREVFEIRLHAVFPPALLPFLEKIEVGIAHAVDLGLEDRTSSLRVAKIGSYAGGDLIEEDV